MSLPQEDRVPSHRSEDAVAAFAALVLAVASVGCASRPKGAQSGDAWSALSGTSWRLLHLEAQDVLAGTIVMLSIDRDGSVSGKAQNRYMGTLTRRGAAGLTIGPLAVTRMHRDEPPGAMEQESRYLRLLESADSFEADQDALRLLSGSTVVLDFARDERGRDS
jgi:heat shock protein HslJ